MDEVTFYSYRYNGGGTKKQIYITINCKNKSFRTNENESGYSTLKYGFSNYELKDYSGVRIDIWTHFMRGCIIDYVH